MQEVGFPGRESLQEYFGGRRVHRLVRLQHLREADLGGKSLQEADRGADGAGGLADQVESAATPEPVPKQTGDGRRKGSGTEKAGIENSDKGNEGTKNSGEEGDGT